MSNLFFRNPRLTILVIGLVLVAGLSSFMILPRMEDPLLKPRAALISTPFPGADAERVESLVTEKIEDELLEIEEIKELRSFSRAGISTIMIELRDEVEETESVWSRIRDKLDDATVLLPSGAMGPEFEDLDLKAFALLVSLKWEVEPESDEQDLSVWERANYTILRRLTKRFENELRALPGTEDVETFGDPEEEIVVEVDQTRLAALGLSVGDVGRQLGASDSKQSAGALRSGNEFQLEVGGEFDTLTRIGQTPIRYGSDGQFVQLADVATLRRGMREPPTSLVVVEGRPAVTLGVKVRPHVRIDHWFSNVKQLLAEHEAQLPRGVEMVQVFEQDSYVSERLHNLQLNLLMGGLAVIAVIFVLMGWRSALIVGSALPLSALMVLAGMRFLDIPVHQMSITGLIIALGLLIDNAIVIVDEVNIRLREGRSPADAVSSAVSHLALPLLGSTLTTAFAFAPIALMPGPAGEFVGSIAISVMLAIFSSLFLSLTVIPAITASGRRISNAVEAHSWWRNGFSSRRLTSLYSKLLTILIGRPALGIVAGMLFPITGFFLARNLPEQFFPPADRNQFQVELELPAQSSLKKTLATTETLRDAFLEHPQVDEVTWFLGRSAPAFYYNILSRRRNTSSYAHALVQLKPGQKPLDTIRELQLRLDEEFPQSRLLVRQLEQGPPFDAPVEVRLYGPDLATLSRLGDELRLLMSQTPNVLHTRSDLTDVSPKLMVDVDEEQARLAGLDNQSIAAQLEATLEGAVGGSVLEETEEMLVRIRVKNSDRADIDAIASIDLLPQAGADGKSGTHVPLTSLAGLNLVPETAAIPHFNGRRMNEIQGYITAGVLPAEVLSEFLTRMEASNFQFPPGYEMEIGGEASRRNDAIGNLMANVGILMVLMVATLVLSFGSFRLAAVIGAVAVLSVGLGLGALATFGYPFGFMAIIGTMGLIGVAINDSIVVLAALQDDQQALTGDMEAIRNVVIRASRHVVATTLTTIAGFVPLLLDGGGFWPPMAICIAGGVGGATILALCFVPAAFRVITCRQCRKREGDATGKASARETSSVKQTPQQPALVGA